MEDPEVVIPERIDPVTTGPRVTLSADTLRHPAFYILIGMGLSIALIYFIKKKV
jgi:hypothetical protein